MIIKCSYPVGLRRIHEDDDSDWYDCSACLAILVYIAVIITGSSLMPGQDEQDEQSIISQHSAIDAA